MKNAAFPDQIGGCEKSMHYPDDPNIRGMWIANARKSV